MYRWLVFLHVLAVFGFLLAHGVAIAVALKLRGEREVARIRALLDLSLSATFLLHISMYTLIIAGIIAGFMGNWWSQLWIWTALGLLLLITSAMGALATRPYTRLRELAHASKPAHWQASPALSPDAAADAAIDQQQLAAAVAATHPWLLTIIGGGGLILILWLMMFKPF